MFSAVHCPEIITHHRYGWSLAALQWLFLRQFQAQQWSKLFGVFEVELISLGAITAGSTMEANLVEATNSSDQHAVTKLEHIVPHLL